MTQADVGHLDESALIAALQAGDDDAFEQVVREYAGRLLAVARRMLQNEDDAQDAVQEALLSAFKSIERFNGDSRLSTWLHRIVVNCCLMRIRSKRRRPEMSIEELLPSFSTDGQRTVSVGSGGGSGGGSGDSGKGWGIEPDHMAISEETRAAVYDAMARLPEEYRNVILLRDIEELSTRETAEVMDTTEGAVKIRLHRARLALRELLDPHFAGDVPK